MAEVPIFSEEVAALAGDAVSQALDEQRSAMAILTLGRASAALSEMDDGKAAARLQAAEIDRLTGWVRLSSGFDNPDLHWTRVETGIGNFIDARDRLQPVVDGDSLGLPTGVDPNRAVRLAMFGRGLALLGLSLADSGQAAVIYPNNNQLMGEIGAFRLAAKGHAAAGVVALEGSKQPLDDYTRLVGFGLRLAADLPALSSVVHEAYSPEGKLAYSAVHALKHLILRQEMEVKSLA